MKIDIYTDGACSGNPGKGGYGIVMLSGTHKKELSAGYRLTTNNRMELLAVIVGLQTIKIEKANVTIYSDSKYVCDAINLGWVYAWLKKGFKGKKNEDLWRQYLEAQKPHSIHVQWVKGHADNFYNNRCDVLATTAAQNLILLQDVVYEQISK